MSAASLLRSRCGTRKRASDSGSATVADSPIARSCGASCHSRARPSDSRSPRLEVTSACNSSSTMRFSERKQKRRVVGRQQQRQLLRRGQQDIRRIAPLPLPPRHRRVAGAGLDLDRQAHLGDRRLQIARDIDRERLQRRDVERVQAAAALHAAAGGDEIGSEVAMKTTALRARSCCLAAAPPPPARAARGGEGSGVGGASADSLPDERARGETPHPRPLPAASRREGSRAQRRCDGADSSTSVGRNPASVLPAPVGAISSAERSSRAFASSAS